ncbi:uncharacterized protein MELLADRAFT_93975 [Melampsora larici-populina 98AG31]|uniref:Uncharacterized protein n=1 Tax=Melampsora larici-populina (strain 98AG31 / pathotype 3-4-7) TaxID=747676 RepID=F4S5Y9_MELLP|nr:uncharacterized protein MELLADRAFT_93975 [Melampsora larici-populina 98AG31]EGF99937.1 hypothetical protein MELLADRAFT_93975 [Melampsora larici-populina 98AG31]
MWRAPSANTSQHNVQVPMHGIQTPHPTPGPSHFPTPPRIRLALPNFRDPHQLTHNPYYVHSTPPNPFVMTNPAAPFPTLSRGPHSGPQQQSTPYYKFYSSPPSLPQHSQVPPANFSSLASTLPPELPRNPPPQSPSYSYTYYLCKDPPINVALPTNAAPLPGVSGPPTHFPPAPPPLPNFPFLGEPFNTVNPHATVHHNSNQMQPTLYTNNSEHGDVIMRSPHRTASQQSAQSKGLHFAASPEFCTLSQLSNLMRDHERPHPPAGQPIMTSYNPSIIPPTPNHTSIGVQLGYGGFQPPLENGGNLPNHTTPSASDATRLNVPSPFRMSNNLPNSANRKDPYPCVTDEASHSSYPSWHGIHSSPAPGEATYSAVEPAQPGPSSGHLTQTPAPPAQSHTELEAFKKDLSIKNLFQSAHGILAFDTADKKARLRGLHTATELHAVEQSITASYRMLRDLYNKGKRKKQNCW